MVTQLGNANAEIQHTGEKQLKAELGGSGIISYLNIYIMAVSSVHLESDAFLVCMNHALSTEKEEVMGLCIGEVK